MTEEAPKGYRVYKTKITDIATDQVNANRGTPEGMEMLRTSIQRLGAGRSVLLDADNSLIAGNKTWETYGGAGGGEVIVIETDGTTLVAVKRTDLHQGDLRREEMAIADNRSGEKNLSWDPNILAAMAEQGVNLDPYVNQDELAEMLQRDQDAMEQMARDAEKPLQVEEPERIPLAIVLRNSEFKRWNNYKAQTGEMDDRKAFMSLLEHFERHTGI